MVENRFYFCHALQSINIIKKFFFTDPEYRKFLESYCADEEKICANPEILLGEIEAKTRELIGLFS